MYLLDFDQKNYRINDLTIYKSEQKKSGRIACLLFFVFLQNYFNGDNVLVYFRKLDQTILDNSL